MVVVLTGMVESEEGTGAKTMLTVKEVGKMLKIHELTVRKMCVEGTLPGVKVGRQWRFDPDILNTWIEEQTKANMAQKEKEG